MNQSRRDFISTAASAVALSGCSSLGLATKKYYQVCEDLIKDTMEIFDHPRFFHLGYDEEFDVSKANEIGSPYVQTFEDLDNAGFDQVPTGSNWSCDTNFDGLVKFCDSHCSKERIKGYMMAPWLATLEKYEAKALEAIAQMEPVIKARKA